MANYGVRAGLGPDYESKYHMRAQSASPTIGVNSEAMDFQMPYRATFLNGLPESKEDFTAAYAHGMNSNDDDASNARYQELAQRETELKEEIMKLETEIAWQEKLRDNEMSGDPMWEVAKQQYVQKGDSSALEGIMSRKTQVELAKDNAKKESDDKKEANDRSARFSRDYMMEILKNYDAVKADPNKRIDAGRDLIKAYQDFREKAEVAGKTEKDYFKENEVLLDQVKIAIDDARTTQTTEIKKQQDASAAAKAKTAENNEVENAVKLFNSTSHTASEAKAEKNRLTNLYPKFVFTVGKGNTIKYDRKAGK